MEDKGNRISLGYHRIISIVMGNRHWRGFRSYWIVWREDKINRRPWRKVGENGKKCEKAKEKMYEERWEKPEFGGSNLKVSVYVWSVFAILILSFLWNNLALLIIFTVLLSHQTSSSDVVVLTKILYN